jgi:hypothetical protein
MLLSQYLTRLPTPPSSSRRPAGHSPDLRLVESLVWRLGNSLPGQTRRLNRVGNLKPVDDSLPLDLGFLEIDEQTQSPAPEGVGHLENGSEHPLGQGVEVSAFIGVISGS